jgi:hypothetical protein
VFDGPEDYHHRINDPELSIDESSMLFMRNVGPLGFPGGWNNIFLIYGPFLFETESSCGYPDI